jgi:exodeoxyribonuclease V beta subunit
VSDLLSDVQPFDVCGPLPSGVTVLEASAGTGKTYTIAALAARYIAEGHVTLDQMLLVTFTRMATGELRDRVRERLVATEQGLERAEGGVLDERDDVVTLLASAPPAEVARRRERLARALADFDAATIATTHGFCQEVLGGLGVAGDVEPDATLVEDPADLVEEVVDDLYVRRFYKHGMPDFDRRQAQLIGRVAVENPETPIEPIAAPDTTVEAMRRRLAHAVRDELERRKRRAGVMTYDDLLTRLKRTLADPVGGPAAAAKLRRRYRVVLVDEFQDTDPVQWEIMQRAFAGGGVTLVLIGDPKQAIYAFRGADVYAYLAAARAADVRATLQTNWRSDQGLLQAYDALFGEARLGHPGIVYRRVSAAPANVEPRLIGAPSPAPLRVRVVHRDEPTVTLTRSRCVSNASAREHIARDLAADLVRLLSSQATVEIRDDDGTVKERRPIRPGHVAVLVRTHRNAALVRDALEDAGIPAVINGAGSVFATPQAREWLRLLEALERPASTTRARSAALTAFLGWSTEQVAAAGDEEWEDLHRRLHRWARVLRLRGVASLMEAIMVTEGLPGRVLAAPDGERRMTDLRHVGQLLHAAATTEQLGVTALAQWLRARIAAAEQETGDEERSRRLESDAEAVQVLTIHRSKGLEFPVVYYPYLWEPGFIPREPQPVFFHDSDNGDARTIDVGLGGPDWQRHVRRHEAEQRGEDLRLAYVALTRAQHQAVVWWAPSWDSRNSALGRLLFARGDDGTIPPAGTFTPPDDVAVARFEQLAAEAPGCVAVEPSTLGPPAVWQGDRPVSEELRAERFDRDLDERWRRTSYSDITAAAHEAHDARVASEPEEDVVADEDVAAPRAPALAAAPDDAPPALLAEMPVGPQVGTFVHRVLEAADFAAPDLDAELTACVRAERARRNVEIGETEAVVAGLRAVIEHDLGGGLRLRDVRRADRLDELAFELPLAGGDEPTGALALDAIAAALASGLPAGDPLAPYAERLADPSLRRDVRGFLTGSIDLVVRLPSGAFALMDYKTNWLGPPGEDLTLWHYRPEAIAAEMERAHYALQALLYTVALHRYLRWRLPGYDPDTHLAGARYLFLRGMAGAPAAGVFTWTPPGALVATLSDVLDRGMVPA